MKNYFLQLVSVAAILAFSCTSEITNPTANDSGKLILKIDKQNAPANVVFVKAYLTRENYQPIFASLNLLSDTTAELLLDEVDAGNWHLKVDAENDSSLVLYTGETNVEVFAGFTSQVYLTLQPTGAGTGSIYIHVTWGVPVNHNWIDYQYNPLLSSSNQYFDEFGIAQPQIIFSNGIYRMYYLGIAAAASKYVLYAESNDGINWNKPISNPILFPGNYGTWDSWAVHPGAVFKDNDGYYKMYYCGYSDQYDQWHIGLATSIDGINWEKYPQPILYGTSGWEYQIGSSSIIKKDGVYYLYYYGRTLPTYAIAVATSTDGINFTKYSGNPILTNQQSWELNGVLYPSVIEENTQLKMVYMNSNGSGFGIATSSDGFNWTKANNNPFFTNLNTANSWAASKIAYPSWLSLSNETRIYYSGISNYNDEFKIGMMRKSGN
ncbi:MAG: hypothetical protein WAU11_02650 [Ignavibacteriaceae bacterium]